MTFDEDSGSAAVFVVNRDLRDSTTVRIDVRDLGVGRVAEAVTLHDDDPCARNTREQPERVGLTPNGSAGIEDGILTVVLPSVSWSAISLQR
ncbi:alpha-L-arabinofuranosidase C-terminal domain-containing protein [Lysobacter korlensis]|uniref:Alpha-L-arabinofuranosidase C-terminal domain-containing protein n=1 Tax=Lysobacter korlensis TaxID=553636 RepID=A0ABV6RS98_9GAMM